MKLLVIMACHNRRALTIRAIDLAKTAADQAGVEIAFTVFDDGSVDGTAEALSAMPYTIQTLRGDGTAYWARGMALAETAALAGAGNSEDEFIVWLNDDVTLDRTAFLDLRKTTDQNPGAIVVGSMRDPSTGAVSYSGMRRDGPHPLSFKMVSNSAIPQSLDTFHGNLVIVPVAAARALGGIDGGFSHAFADIDYGLRSQRVGVALMLAPHTQGTCARTPAPQRQTNLEDWRAYTGPKGGGNLRSLRRILRKSNRRSWHLVIAGTYALWWVRRIAPPCATRLVRQ